MKNPLFEGVVAGMDEAGRGSWAGPVVAAAVILPRGVRLAGLDDSKKLTPESREKLYPKIIELCAYGVGLATHTEVDELGLLPATQLAFSRALGELQERHSGSLDHLFIDGRDKFIFPVPHTSVIRGDGIYRCIAAASIVAKVTRDHLMVEWAQAYPEYGFDLHKGYGTESHQEALRLRGPCDLHRLSYKPLKVLQQQAELFESL